MNYRIIIIALLCLACVDNKSHNDNSILGNQKVTFVINTLPENHDYNDAIYISGNFEGWSGGRDSYKLKQSDSLYNITIPKHGETINFKFTKGKWGTEECQLNGNPIENRNYTFKSANDTVWVEILNWVEPQHNMKASTATENVEVFSENFHMPQINSERRIQVYLPPNYQLSKERYPVIYMLDGQNVFDVATSFSGEWEVDETLNAVFEESGFGIIVVAIDHAKDKRFSEYAPWDHDEYGKGQGKAFAHFIIQNLKPEIDRSYRTKSDAQNTAIGGSSMGGLMSHYLAFLNPDIFGKALIFSPSFWVAEPIYGFTEQQMPIKQSKLYYLAGGEEGEGMVANLKKMANLLKDMDIEESQLEVKVVSNGIHGESFWRVEFEEAVKWLFDIKNES